MPWFNSSTFEKLYFLKMGPIFAGSYATQNKPIKKTVCWHQLFRQKWAFFRLSTFVLHKCGHTSEYAFRNPTIICTWGNTVSCTILSFCKVLPRIFRNTINKRYHQKSTKKATLANFCSGTITKNTVWWLLWSIKSQCIHFFIVCFCVHIHKGSGVSHQRHSTVGIWSCYTAKNSY